MPPIPPPQPQQPSIGLNPPQAQPAAQPQPAPVAVVGSNLNIGLVIFAACAAMMTFFVGLAVLIAAVVYFGGLWPRPSNPTTVDFVKLGQEYGKLLGPSYAPAWKSYAADLRAGKPIADASKNMGSVWAKNREAVYDKILTPELSRIVPDETPNEQVTPAQRAALAAAADDLAKGLGGPP